MMLPHSHVQSAVGQSDQMQNFLHLKFLFLQNLQIQSSSRGSHFQLSSRSRCVPHVQNCVKRKFIEPQSQQTQQSRRTHSSVSAFSSDSSSVRSSSEITSSLDEFEAAELGRGTSECFSRELGPGTWDLAGPRSSRQITSTLDELDAAELGRGTSDCSSRELGPGTGDLAVSVS